MPQKNVGIRFPDELLKEVDSIAATTKKTRSEVILSLIRKGLEQSSDGLSNSVEQPPNNLLDTVMQRLDRLEKRLTDLEEKPSRPQPDRTRSIGTSQPVPIAIPQPMPMPVTPPVPKELLPPALPSFACPNCGSGDFRSDGIREANSVPYQRRICRNCQTRYKGVLSSQVQSSDLRDTLE